MHPKMLFDHRKQYSELKSLGLLSPLTSNIQGMKEDQEPTEHFVTPRGVSSIVKHFFSKAGVTVGFQNHVTEVTEVDGKWTVKTQV